MKKTLIFLFILVSGLCRSQISECSKLKIGKFKYVDNRFKNITITRTENSQEEFDATSGKKIKGRIEWKSDCEYTVTFDGSEKADIRNMLGKKIYVKIVEIHNNKFKLHTTMGEQAPQDFEMIKIE